MYRFALPPTGDMHIENLRTALFNFIAARQNGEQFLVRIEDIDKENYVAGKEQEMLEILSLFGITWDQISYQSENLKFHHQLAAKLLMDQKAFSCFCTPEALEQKKEAARAVKQPYRYDGTCKRLSDAEVLNNESPFVVRIKKPQGDVVFTDLIKGELRFSPDDIDDFVIMNVDKTPTCTFASAIDDMMFDVSVVIREEADLCDTPEEILIRDYLGYEKEIRYAHLPTILNNNTSNVKQLLEKGFLPSAIANYLILLGNKTPEEIFTLDEAIAWFDVKNISETAAKFEIEKLRQINREHIRRTENRVLAVQIGYSAEEIGKLAKCYTEEASTLQEIKEKIDKIFTPKKCEDFEESFHKLQLIAKNAPYFPEYDAFENYLMQESGLQGEHFFQPLRVMLTGAQNGPDLRDLYPFIKNYLGEIIQ